jgi:biopolymer transport protein ExbD
MVDLAFLLVTFFMLTAQFRPEQAVAVDTPSSMSTSPIPLENLMTIIVDSSGRVFWDFTDKKVRTEVIKQLAAKYNLELTEEQVTRFTNLNALGMPAQLLPQYLALNSPSERKALDLQHKGIPIDSVNNQLFTWISITQQIFYNGSDPHHNPLVALKGDGNVNYSTMNKVIKTFQSPGIKINRFKMITDLEETRM